MQANEHRRKTKRFPACWKTGVVFDKAAGKPVLHTQTLDLSLGGAAIHSEYGDLTGTTVTMLLARPGDASEPQRMVRVRARIVSTIHTPDTQGYRLGVSFLDVSPADMAVLGASLEGADAGGAPVEVTAEGPAAAPEPAPAAPPAGGRLAALRQLAQAKLTEEKKPDPREALEARVEEALKKAYAYFKELVEQLNVVKPPFTHMGYSIAGVPEFSGLAWDSGRTDLRTREVGTDRKRLEQVALYYRVSANKTVRVEREYPKSERLQQLLKDYRIEAKVREKRNERGSVLSTAFEFPCQLEASAVLEANFETGKLLLRMRNVECFGTMEYLVDPAAVTEAALEEFTGFVLGESNRVGALLAGDR